MYVCMCKLHSCSSLAVVVSVSELVVFDGVYESGKAGDGFDVESELGDRVRIDILPNDITYKRLSSGIAALEASKFGPASRVINV